jgi:hypothetical protein
VISLPEIDARRVETNLFGNIGNRQATPDSSVTKIVRKVWLAEQLESPTVRCGSQTFSECGRDWQLGGNWRSIWVADTWRCPCPVDASHDGINVTERVNDFDTPGFGI